MLMVNRARLWWQERQRELRMCRCWTDDDCGPYGPGLAGHWEDCPLHGPGGSW